MAKLMHSLSGIGITYTYLIPLPTLIFTYLKYPYLTYLYLTYPYLQYSKSILTVTYLIPLPTQVIWRSGKTTYLSGRVDFSKRSSTTSLDALGWKININNYLSGIGSTYNYLSGRVDFSKRSSTTCFAIRRVGLKNWHK